MLGQEHLFFLPSSALGSCVDVSALGSCVDVFLIPVEEIDYIHTSSTL